MVPDLAADEEGAGGGCGVSGAMVPEGGGGGVAGGVAGVTVVTVPDGVPGVEGVGVAVDGCAAPGFGAAVVPRPVAAAGTACAVAAGVGVAGVAGVGVAAPVEAAVEPGFAAGAGAGALERW